MKNSILVLLLGVVVALKVSYLTFAQETKYDNLAITKIALGGYSAASYFEVGRPKKGKK